MVSASGAGIPDLAVHMPELMGAAVACGYDKVRMLYMRKLDPKPQVGGRVAWAVEPIVALLDLLERSIEIDWLHSNGGREAFRALAAIEKESKP